MASSSSSSSLPLQYAYEVFLSFRGEDTRYTFTDHLYAALDRRGIKTFRDNEELNRGEDISQELLKAIEESRVSIIVFSSNYASSRWCLDELVHILECRRSKGQEVRAVFYRVDPSDVRNQRGAFGEAFAELDQCKYKDSISQWRKALKEAADLSGWPYKDGGYEAKFINDIVDELSAKLVNPLPVADHPVGLDSCSKAVEELLDLKENVFRMVGIWGAGGIGKTTIAKEVFNSIRHKFGGSCFLADVRSNSKIFNGLAQLQETLLTRILGDSNLKIRSVDEGVGFIKTRMQHKKVLIILDDVSDYFSQLKKLVPSRDCFGPGSRILITTRDKGCLRDVVPVYEVKTLNDCQAMKLFSMAAFGKNIPKPPSEYQKLAERAIRYAQGLPLALIVLGSHLYLQSRDEWEDTIGSCRGVPHMNIQDILRLSYDALGEDLKEAFLDIACFFKGEKVERVKPILQACYGLNSGIEQLQQKALLRIDRNEFLKKDMIWMHDLIEEMGKKIANSEGKPDENTRLWRYDDAKRALSDNTGTKKIKGIQLDEWRKPRDRICLNAKCFSNMENLRYFAIRNIFIEWSGNIDHLSNELRYLQWPECPLQSFPSNFHPNKLVNLHISNICHITITRLWDGRKNSPNLKFMDLKWCASLREFPDLSGIPNLIELHLIGCRSLVEIPHSFGSLEKLEILDLQACTGLLEFPKFIGKLGSLRELNLSYTGIKCRIDDEKQLWLECCQNLTILEILKLSGCSELVRFLREASISPDDDSGSLLLPKLREFDIRFCDLSTADFIGDLDCLETLNDLKLSFNKFVTLPALGKFVNLEYLSLHSCKRLREIPELPPNILQVNARKCKSLERFSMLPKYSLNTVQMDLSNCYRFSICLGDDMKMMENILLNNQDSPFSLLFPSLGSEVPDWFYCSKEFIATDHYPYSTFTVSFEIPSKLELENIAGVAICPVISDWIDLRACLSINGVHIHQYSYNCPVMRTDHMWVGYTPLSGEIKRKLLGQWPYKCQVEFHCPRMTSCGVRLVCQPPIENSNKMVMADKPAGESGMHTIVMSPPECTIN